MFWRSESACSLRAGIGVGRVAGRVDMESAQAVHRVPGGRPAVCAAMAPYANVLAGVTAATEKFPLPEVFTRYIASSARWMRSATLMPS